MTKKEDFKILTPREHVRFRTGMYVGSSSVEEVDRFMMGKWKTVRYVPALMKMIDEIIDNSVDEAIRTKFKFANKISVTVDGNEVTVEDNGRGIPQDKIFDSVTQTEILRPVAAWTKVNAGTSFDSERVTIGTNGVGSAATNFLSEKFIGRTWSGGNLVEVRCSEGGLHVHTKESSKIGNGTKVQFVPDFSIFAVDSLSEFDTIHLIEDRLVSLQMSFPEIKFWFNGARIHTNEMKKYADLFFEENTPALIEKSDNLNFFIGPSEDGYRSNSYVNGVNTRLGGVYSDFLVNSVVDVLFDLVKKKHKIEVVKSTIKNGLTFVSFIRDFKNPKFDSQTKERLTNSITEVKEHYASCSVHDATWIAKKIMNTPEIIEPIIAAQLAKKLAQDKRDALAAQKKLKKVKVAKHIAANSDQATLALIEGDSAAGFLLKVRDPNKIGAYPLRGVVMNTWEMKPVDVLKNKELSELVAILGIDVNDPNSIDNMQYKNIATLTDADHDGGKIAILIIGFLYKFWPRLFEEGRVQMIRSPIMISSKGSDTKWFYTYEEAHKFKETSKGYIHRYIKGLGSLNENEYDRIINDPYLDIITIDDVSKFDLMVGPDAEPRKVVMLANDV